MAVSCVLSFTHLRPFAPGLSFLRFRMKPPVLLRQRLRLFFGALMKMLLILIVLAAVCGPMLAADNGWVQTGTASWYGAESSKKTASGERYDPSAMTAAHRTLPLGTMVQIRNLKTGCSVTVRVNDRGPYCKGRIVDVSKAAAEQLKMTTSGTAKVQVAVLK